MCRSSPATAGDAATTTLECCEGARLKIPGGAANVSRAWYGPSEHRWEEGLGVECADRIAARLAAASPERSAMAVASNAWIGEDPAPGVKKVLLIELREPVEAPPEEPARSPAAFESPAEVPSAPQWLLFARHAQAGHNVDAALAMHPDNPLTKEGREQALLAGKGPLGALLRSADLVVTSPLTRAMETTALLLEGAGAEGARVLVHAGATERWGAPCDEGRPKSELLPALPAEMRGWEGWDALPEKWWPGPEEDAWERAEAFAETVRKQRSEERIAFVGHGGFWEIVLGRYLDNCGHVCCERSLN